MLSQPENEKVYSQVDYVAVCSETTQAWFPFGLFVPFIARLGFILPVLVFPAPMFVATFCCSS